MKMIIKIAKTELQSLFYSAGSLVAFGGFCLSSGNDHVRFVGRYCGSAGYGIRGVEGFQYFRGAFR